MYEHDHEVLHNHNMIFFKFIGLTGDKKQLHNTKNQRYIMNSPDHQCLEDAMQRRHLARKQVYGKKIYKYRFIIYCPYQEIRFLLVGTSHAV